MARRLRSYTRGQPQQQADTAMAIGDPQEHWASNLSNELVHWQVWFEKKGRETPEDYVYRLRKDTPLHPLVDAEVCRCPCDVVNILEVGCGPATIMGYVPSCGGKQILASYCDPLAGEYTKLWSKHGLTQPHTISPVSAESVTVFFARNSFDIAFACNCLDHSANPLDAIASVLRVIRPGGAFITIHHPREGERGRGVGLHQWNLYEGDGKDRGRFMLSHINGPAVDVGKELAAAATVETLRTEPGLVTAILRKR